MIAVKIFLRKQKSCLILKVDIYKRFVLEEENLKFEKTIGETVKLKNQTNNLSETPE